MERKRERERGYPFGVDRGIQSKAIERYMDMHDYIEIHGEIKAEDLFAYMFETWGTTEKTVARYLKVAVNRGKLEINGQIIKRKNLEN